MRVTHGLKRAIVRAGWAILSGMALWLGLGGSPALADPISFLPPAGTEITFNVTNALSAPGSPNLEGIFTTTSIQNSSGSTVYWGSGISDGTQLNGVFRGLTLNSTVSGPGGTTYGYIGGTGGVNVSGVSFVGGGINIYNVPGGSYSPTGPPASTLQVCGAGGCGSPWLQLEFVPNAGNSLMAMVNGSDGSMTAYFRVIGGTAAALFNNNGFLGGLADGKLMSTFTIGSGIGSWTTSGVGMNQVMVVNPEPTSLLLLGSGLAGWGAWRRRSSRQALA